MQKMRITTRSEAREAYQAAIADKEQKKAVWDSFPNHKMDDRKAWAASSEAKHPLLGDRSFHPCQAAWTPLQILLTTIKSMILLGVDPVGLIKSQAQLFDWSPDGPRYALLVSLALEKPIEEFENTIAKDSESSYLYAKYVLEGRFELGEGSIQSDGIFVDRYNRFVGE
tara:strand:+ start:2140 stop:2646 length:507 start_codon:yes stop_codon:yes gene_type:complete